MVSLVRRGRAGDENACDETGLPVRGAASMRVARLVAAAALAASARGQECVDDPSFTVDGYDCAAHRPVWDEDTSQYVTFCGDSAVREACPESCGICSVRALHLTDSPPVVLVCSNTAAPGFPRHHLGACAGRVPAAHVRMERRFLVRGMLSDRSFRSRRAAVRIRTDDLC